MEPNRNFIPIDGETTPVSSPRSDAEIEGWCVAYLAKMLERPENEIDPRKSFQQLGLDSAMAVYFVVDMEEWLGIELTPELPLEYPSIEKISAHIAGLTR